MSRKILLFAGLFIFALALSGCRTAGQGYAAQPFNQGYAQPQIGGQNSPIFGGGYQQAGTAPTMQQTQAVLGNLGRNLGSRFSNGVINRGVNHLINGVFSGF